MSILRELIGGVLPFVTLAVLILGLAYRIRKWQKAAVANLAVYPAASSKWALRRKILREVLFFNTFRKENRALWSRTWIFHLTLLVILLGHTRLITDWPLRVLFGLPEGTVNTISAWGGGICGAVAMVACLLLLTRRFTIKRVQEISTGEDYSALALLLLILATGNIMRFAGHFDIAVAQAYFASLFSFQATQVPSDPMFLLHLFLVQALLIYLPFGKLLHIPGIFYSKALVTKDY
jgi:nitrate reductase gamma subunit